MKNIFAANWKLNKGPKETREYFTKLLAQASITELESMVFFVPATNLEAAAETLKGKPVKIGPQNCYLKTSGAFTGEVSAQVAKEIGATVGLVGHSERRQFFGETDQWVTEKSYLLQSLGLAPMICVGESLSERQSGMTNEVVKAQLSKGIEKLDLSKSFYIAYEPIWAIGTGQVATHEQVSEVHAFLRSELMKLKPELESTPILYGGSVKPENAKSLLSIKDVNGFLVGGASLEVESFLAICRAG